MIKINKLSKDKIIEYKNEIFLKLKKIREKIEKSEEYISEYDDIINDIFLKIDIIIGGKLEEIINCYEDIRERYPNYLSEIGCISITNSQEKFNNYISKIFDYTKVFKGDMVYNFIEDLNITVCPYCNRNYINVVKKGKRKRRPDLDHFIPKRKYPLFSLSISNLVPSCSYCNGFKSDILFTLDKNIYPFNEGIDDIEYFDYTYKNTLNDISVVLKNNNDKMNANAEIFQLEELYKQHINIVKDIKEKNEFYNKMYYEAFNKLNGFEKITENEIKYFLGYTNLKDIKNTSLSKFKNDIINRVRK